MQTFRALALALLALPATSFAQTVNITVGPSEVPLGSQVAITLSNDNPHKFGIMAPLYEVRDAQGAVVYVPSQPAGPKLLAQHGWSTFEWNLTDLDGQPVPPGDYTVVAQFETWSAPTPFPVRVIEQGAGLVYEGTATTKDLVIGSGQRRFRLHSPDDPGRPFLLLGALSSAVGTPTCGAPLPLDLDPLLSLSLTPGAVFQHSFGVLDAQGASSAPTFDLPDQPVLVGLHVDAAYLVLDPAEPCPVRRLSNVHSMTIH